MDIKLRIKILVALMIGGMLAVFADGAIKKLEPIEVESEIVEEIDIKQTLADIKSTAIRIEETASNIIQRVEEMESELEVANESEPVVTISTEEGEVIIEPKEGFITDDGVKNDITKVEIDPTDLELLACVIYQEAGGNGSCDECRRRVADVVLNRVESDRFPNTIEEVLTAKRQYGRFHWTGVIWPERASNPGEKEAVARAYRIAEEVLSGQHSELYGQGYIWQAEFKQGTEQIYHCGHYFGR